MSLRTYFANYKFPVVFTRAANVYGPGQQLYRIIPRTIVAAMGGQKLRLDGGGKSVRVFIHMTDVSDATVKIARDGTLGETYHISGYELVSIRDAGGDDPAAARQDPSTTASRSVRNGRARTPPTCSTASKLRNELGWRDTHLAGTGHRRRHPLGRSDSRTSWQNCRRNTSTSPEES